MDEPTLPSHLVEARRTPVFDPTSLPGPLVESHRTTVWAVLRVQAGSVRFVDLEGADRRDLKVGSGDEAVIAPGIEHQVEPSTDARFFIQFFREPGADLFPESPAVAPADEPGPRGHRGRDLDDEHEIFEMVTRQYFDVAQDQVLVPYFDVGPDFRDWQALIGTIADYWSHVLLYAGGYEVDVIETHRPLHDRAPFSPELFDRWLSIFHDTVDEGWSGPLATSAKKRATGMVWAMAHRFLGPGVWTHPDQRTQA